MGKFIELTAGDGHKFAAFVSQPSGKPRGGVVVIPEIFGVNSHIQQVTDGFAAERVIGQWIAFYNTERPHSALDGQTPAEAYSTGRPVDMMDNASALPTSPQAQQHQKAFNMIRVLAA